MILIPKTQTENIAVQNLNDEVLIYNLTTNQAFCLNDTSAKVFNACDGVTTFTALKEQHQLTDEIIYLALDGLQKENLIAGEYASPHAGMSRREVIRKVGLASMIALPVIASIVAPTAAHAASGCSNPLSTNIPNDCPVGNTIGGGGTCGNPANTSNYNTFCQDGYGARCQSGNAKSDTCTQLFPGTVEITCVCTA